MAIKKFKPKNLDDYVELKPGIWARKDRLKVPITKRTPAANIRVRQEN